MLVQFPAPWKYLPSKGTKLGRQYESLYYDYDYIKAVNICCHLNKSNAIISQYDASYVC